MPYGRRYKYWSRSRRARGKTTSYRYWRSRKSTPRYRSKYSRSWKRSPWQATTKARIRGPVPLSDEYICKFKYSEDNYLSPSSSTSPTYLDIFKYSMNSLYDPDFTGGGNQPYMYDQLVGTLNSATKPYTQYIVYGAKCTVTFYADSANTVPVCCYLYPVSSQTQTIPNTLSDLDELPYIKRADVSLPGGSSSVRTLSTYMPIHKVEKMDKSLWKSDMLEDYSADGNNDPTKEPLFLLMARPISLNTACKVYYNVKIVYYSKLFGRSDYLNNS